jgi:hypothetical protein
MECIYKWKQVGDMLLMVMSEGYLSVEQMAQTNELHRTEQVTKGFAIALGNPNMTPDARKALAEAMRDHRGYAATDSRIVRGVIKAMNWLGNPMKACATDVASMRVALEDLGVPTAHTVDELLSEIETLRRQCEVELQRGS